MNDEEVGNITKSEGGEKISTSKKGKKIEGVLMRLQDIEKKRKVMLSRKNLKGTNIFDDSLTKTERKI